GRSSIRPETSQASPATTSYLFTTFCRERTPRRRTQCHANQPACSSCRRMPADSASLVIATLEGLKWPDSTMGVAIATGLRGLLALRAGDTAAARDLL